MGSLAETEIRDFLQRLGERCTKRAMLYLLGGGGLCMLGNPRRTVDIDVTTETLGNQTTDLIRVIEATANELRVELEVIPIEEFVPLPEGAETRHKLVGQFGNLTVYVYDPYTIALSKLARGFESDLQDVLFLLRRGIIRLDELTLHVEAALPRAWDFNIDPGDLRQYMGEIRRLYSR
ncbi:MAG: DUF6036 family nucleotidyltransferase [Chloroflexota bacterium]